MKYSSEEIGKIILKERKKLDMTQKELGDKIGLVGKQISAYEKGKPAPPVDVMFKLCEVFGCELGYLLGQPGYEGGTALKTAVSERTGLSEKAMNNVLHITGDDESCLSFGCESARYRRVLDKLFSDNNFLTLVEELAILDELVNRHEKLPDKFYKKHGKELFEFALANNEAAYDNNEQHKYNVDEYTDEQRLAIIDANNMIDRLISLENSIRIERYEVREAFESLIDSLYPRERT